MVKTHLAKHREGRGSLAEMLRALRTAAETHLGNRIYYAPAACPNLVALYREDIEDAFEYLSLKSLGNPNNLFRLYREPAGVEASYGLGLCHDPSNVDRCNKEEYEIPITTVLTVLYTKNALYVEVSVMKSAYAYYPYPTSPPSMDFNLGSQALHGNPDEEYYWQAVRDRIMAGVAEGLPGRRPTKVFLLGDSTYEDKFRAVRKDALKSILGHVPGATIKTPFSALHAGRLNSQGVVALGRHLRGYSGGRPACGGKDEGQKREDSNVESQKNLGMEPEARR